MPAAYEWRGGSGTQVVNAVDSNCLGAGAGRNRLDAQVQTAEPEIEVATRVDIDTVLRLKLRRIWRTMHRMTATDWLRNRRRRVALPVLLAALIVTGCQSVSPPPNTGSGLACRLPVAGYVPGGLMNTPSHLGVDGQPSRVGTGGFVDFPTGKYTPAADSNESYLAGQGVWLPVAPEAVAPDKKSYVQTVLTLSSITPPSTSLLLVDVKTRSERLLFKAAGGQRADVVAFNGDGIYVSSWRGASGESQLLLIKPATGDHGVIAGSYRQTGGFTAIAGGAAWGMDVIYPHGSSGPEVIKLLRLGLNDGSVAAWYEVPWPFAIGGLDASNHPILTKLNAAFPAASTPILVTAPNQGQALEPKGGQFFIGTPAVVADRHGAWMGSSDGSIWLYSSAAGLRKVATAPPQAGGTGQPNDERSWRSIAGPCV